MTFERMDAVCVAVARTDSMECAMTLARSLSTPESMALLNGDVCVEKEKARDGIVNGKGVEAKWVLMFSQAHTETNGSRLRVSDGVEWDGNGNGKWEMMKNEVKEERKEKGTDRPTKAKAITKRRKHKKKAVIQIGW